MSDRQMIIGLVLVWTACIVQVGTILALAWLLLGPV